MSDGDVNVRLGQNNEILDDGHLRDRKDERGSVADDSTSNSLRQLGEIGLNVFDEEGVSEVGRIETRQNTGEMPQLEQPEVYKKNFAKLKKRRGESFAKEVRGVLSEFLNIPEFSDEMLKLIPNKHKATETLRDNIEYLRGALNMRYQDEIGEAEAPPKNPYELATRAGYELSRPLDTVEQVEAYMGDFRQRELLCTFNDIEGRLRAYNILWLRHHNADNIVPADELNPDNMSEEWKQYLAENNRYDRATGQYDLTGLRPKREDPYGRSSMSVQISKKSSHVSIKNRYNHTVSNPDATLSNNLDNLVPELKRAVYAEVGREGLLKGADAEPHEQYVLDREGGLHNYYYEKNNAYFGYYETIHNGEVIKIPENEYLMLSPEIYVKVVGDCEVVCADEDSGEFIVDREGDRVSITQIKGGDEVAVYSYTADQGVGKPKDLELLVTDKKNYIDIRYSEITKLSISDGVEMGSIFGNPALTHIDISEKASAGSINDNPALIHINIAKEAKVGVICRNPMLARIDISERARTRFIRDNSVLTNIDLAKEAETGDIRENPALTHIDISEMAKTGDISHNPALTHIDISEMAKTGDINDNPILTLINIAKEARVGHICRNPALTHIDISEMAKTGDINDNPILTLINIAKEAEISSIYRNSILTHIDISERAKTRNIHNNPMLTHINIAKEAETWDIYNNPVLARIDIAKETKIGFISYNPALTYINIPEMAETRGIHGNSILTHIDISEKASTGPIYKNPILTHINIAKGAKTGNIYDNPLLSDNHEVGGRGDELLG